MQLNTFAALVKKKLKVILSSMRISKTLRKQSTIYKMNCFMQQAEEFRTKFKVHNNRLNRTTQRNLIVEEVKEFLEEEDNVHDEVFRHNDADALKELADVVYVCFQYAANMEWDLDEALTRVHESNLSKLGDDGHPVLRSDGKVLKGPNYNPPFLQDLV